MKIRTSFLRKLPVMLAAGLASSAVLAGGALNLNPNDPEGLERWPNGGANIPFNVDGVPAGGPTALALGPLTYDEAVASVLAALATWESIPSASQTYSTTGAMPFDIDETNYAPFVDNLFFGNNNADGFSPVVFDDDGAIFFDLFGQSGVLGFASTDTRDADGTPIEAVNFLNGGAILDGFPVADFQGVIFHEYGHYSGLAHTVVNGQNVALGDTSGPTPLNTYGNSPGDQVETMYPFALQGGGQITPHADDVASISSLYPAPDFFATSGAITGQVLAPNGEPVTGVNVIARNIADPFVDAVSSISGDRGEAGTFTINGLTPGAEYTVHIDQILQGGFSTTPTQLAGPEEFYNGGNETNNLDVPDDPAESVTIVPVAGTPVSGIDVLINAVPPPPPGAPLPVGDEDFFELFLPTPFGFCGQEYDSLFVSANGFITFGEPIPGFSFSESAAGMLSGPPRIAGLWDDLIASDRGVVSYQQTEETFTINYDEVPEFPDTGANTFSITLETKSKGKGKSKGKSSKVKNGKFTLAYGALTATGGLAGFSCGGAVTSGFEVSDDLSMLEQPIKAEDSTAIYEIFSGGTNDLSGLTIEFDKTGTFGDEFEDNNTPGDAEEIELPFNTIDVDNFTEISPVGGDADWFRFEASANTTVIAEVLSGQLDSTLGLYQLVDLCPDPGNSGGKSKGKGKGTGNCDPKYDAIPIAIDDDGGSGVLSRVVVPIAEDGTYAIAVSAFPDFDFTGAGGSGGRYVLDVQSIEGSLLDLGDDDTVEVPLEFSFPFNGASYSSVFVNSNGNLTFGAGDTDFSESVVELLSGPPRIAPLWDDLSPNAGGLVIVDADDSTFTVSFQNVPEFFATTGNTFTVTLDVTGTVTVSYAGVAAEDGIAGVSEGGGAADPGPTDLSEALSLPATGTTYEAFSFGNPNDLSGEVLIYTD